MSETVLDDFVPDIAYFVFRKCHPTWRQWMFQLIDHEITYIIKGNARYTINGVAHELGPGDLLYLRQGELKEAITYPQNLMQCYAINFTFKPKAGKAARAREGLFPEVNHIGLRQDIIDMFRELTISWTEQQDGYIIKTRALFMLIINRLAEIILYDVDSEPGDYRVSRVTRYISTHYPEKLTVKNLARQSGLDVDYFGRLFKHETGMSVHQYIAKIRVRNAENMLQSGSFKVQEVALHCGFSDTFHFYKLFKALRGFAPSACIPKKH